MTAHSSWKQRLALAFLPPVGAMLIRLLGATLKYKEIGEPGTHADENPETRVYCMWHRSLLCVAHYFRKRKIAILISPSFDGELIARTIQRVGYATVRGSSSRGGAAALLGMQRALDAEDGTRCNYAALTCDGPRGPIYRAKPGGVKLAQQVGGGVGIFYAAPMRAWELHSWDRFLIPKPFSTVVVGWQMPVPVSPAIDSESLEATRQEIENALERARTAVEEHIQYKTVDHKARH